MNATRVPLSLRLLAVPLTVVSVVVGLWVAGGLITNDFRLAMWLAAAWMALAGAIAVVLAAVSRGLRWPVLGTYVLTALAIGAYLGSSVFMDKMVDEDVATAAPARAAGGAREQAANRNVLLGEGRFQPVRHSVRGTARTIELAAGGRVLTLTEFAVDNGPDLRVYLSAGAAADEADVTDFVDLGGLKGNVGDQQYTIPETVELEQYSTVVIWCRAFSVLFARAPLERS